MVATFQSVVNVQNAFGVPGALYDDGPVRCAPYELVSDNQGYNVIGATAFTVVTPDTGSNRASSVAKAGGTGAFAGILMNSKVYATSGPSTGALDPTLTVNNHTIAELLTMGDIIVSLPAPANVGDLFCYDQTTGKLGTYPKNAAFTGALSTDGILTVSALTAGQIQTGMYVVAAGVPTNVVITGQGTGKGYTGTYTTSYVGVAVAPVAMTSPSLPPAAAAFTGALSTDGVLTVSAVSSGAIAVGNVIYGTGVPSNIVVTGFTSGVGGTGTYTTNYVGVAIVAEAMTSDATLSVPRAEVYQFAPAGLGGLGVMKITS